MRLSTNRPLWKPAKNPKNAPKLVGYFDPSTGAITTANGTLSELFVESPHRKGVMRINKAHIKRIEALRGWRTDGD